MIRQRATDIVTQLRPGLCTCTYVEWVDGSKKMGGLLGLKCKSAIHARVNLFISVLSVQINNAIVDLASISDLLCILIGWCCTGNHFVDNNIGMISHQRDEVSVCTYICQTAVPWPRSRPRGNGNLKAVSGIYLYQKKTELE